MRYIGLLIVLLISFASLSSFDMFDSKENERIETLRLLIPGVAFSIFLLILQREKIKALRFVGLSIALTIAYIINFYIGLSSYGIAVPIAGGLGAIMIRIILNYKNKEWDEKWGIIFGLGFASPILALVFYYLTQGRFNDGIGFGLMITSWQLVIGVEHIQAQQLRK